MEYSRSHSGQFKVRLILALIIAGLALVSYYGKSERNPITGATQRIAMSKGEEIALGLQAAPQMAAEYGGRDPDAKAQALVDAVGGRLLAGPTLAHSEYRYGFHLLADTGTVNAFALPGGQLFITRGMFARLATEGELAAVLAHEIGHVVARHGAQQLAKQQLTQGLAGAAGVATGDHSGQQFALMVGQVVNLKYGRGDELESDRLGVRFMAEAGYDPRAMLRVMELLQSLRSGGQGPEFFSTHPDPKNRIGAIEEAIRLEFPQGIPEGLRS